MYLKYLSVSTAWVFLFGDDVRTAQIIPFGGQRFFPTREEAVIMASAVGLDVDDKGAVTARETAAP